MKAIWLLGCLLLTAWWQRAEAQSLPRLSVGSGVESQVYSNVTVTSLTPTHLNFTHSLGLGSVKLQDLEPELQQLFHFEPQKAKAIQAQQARANSLYEERLQHQAATQHSGFRTGSLAAGGLAAGASKPPNPFAKAPRPSVLLVIAPAQFSQALKPLLQHKRAGGTSCFLLTLESIGSYFGGKDEPERLKRAIAYAQQNLESKFVMLAGDGSRLPVRYRFLKHQEDPVGYPERWQDGAYYASDFYYENLYREHKELNGALTHSEEIDTWDGDGDGRFNTQLWAPKKDITAFNPDKVDGYPDVAVGRVPARTVADVSAYVSKLIAYEKAIAASGPKRAPHHFTFISAKDAYPESVMALFGTLEKVALSANSGALITRLGVNYGESAQLPSQWKRAGFEDLDEAAATSWWLSYDGHGARNAWCTFGEKGRFYDERWVTAHLQSTCLPLVFASACYTCQFTPIAPDDRYKALSGEFVWLRHDKAKEQTQNLETKEVLPTPLTVPPPGPFNSTQCMGQTWLFGSSTGGAIAYFGYNCVASPVRLMGLQQLMLERYNSGDRCLGDMWLNAQRAHWRQFKDSTDYHAPRAFFGVIQFFGDPSLKLD